MEINGKTLVQTLECSGASEETRQIIQEMALHNEITLSYLDKLMNTGIETYYVGSYGEGTTTRSLNSDCDIIQCDYLRFVYEDTSDISNDQYFFLIVRDSYTKPGYVMLQSVTGNVSQTTQHKEPTGENVNKLDKCLKHVRDNIQTIARSTIIRQGPADKCCYTEGIKETDYVFALKTKTIPSFARKWLQRTRHFGWPSSHQMSEFESSDCFFVGVGHPDSDEYRKEREWRISFTLQERHLMYGLNPTQHKCYIILKIVKKNIIQETIGESITSYHCKTALFYTIENSPCEFWVPKNLIKCVRGCLFRLMVWSVQEHCPNYFIPDENMFEKSECRNKLHRIRYITLQILQSGIRFLLKLTTDSVGYVVREFLSGTDSVDISNLIYNKIKFEHIIYASNLEGVLSLRNELLSCISTLSGDMAPNEKLRFLINYCIEHYSSTTQVKQHTKTLVNQAFEPTRLFINLQKAQDLASDLSYCVEEDATLQQEHLTRVLHLTNESRSWDALSAYLIEATVYYRLNMFEECRDTLTQSLTIYSHVCSRCKCSARYYTKDVFEENLLLDIYMKRGHSSLSTKEYRQTYASSCLVIIPSQRHLVHPILHLEMLRSVCETSNDGKEKWHEWIVIDSKIYFYFLKYLLHTKLEDMTQKQEAIDDFGYILEEDRNLGHRETAYNVLSWMYCQENKMAEAYSCLCESWKCKSGHNAAKWHLVLLFWELRDI